MFHPLVATWLARRFGAPTPAQARAWPLIAEGRDVLVTAPTGSGKTLAAFLSALDGLVAEAVEETGATEQKQMGQVMSALMPKVAGRADGKRVSAAVRKKLGA